jgi:phytoene synthase
VLACAGLGAACEAVAARAAEHFAAASRVMAAAPRRAVRAPRLMEAAYRDILLRLRRRGWTPPRQPVRVDRLRLAGALLRYGFF